MNYFCYKKFVPLNLDLILYFKKTGGEHPTKEQLGKYKIEFFTERVTSVFTYHFKDKLDRQECYKKLIQTIKPSLRIKATDL